MGTIAAKRRSYVGRVLEAVVERGGSDEQRLRSSLLVGSSFLTILAGFLWGALYLIFNEPIAGAIPIAYSLLSLVSLGLFLLTRNYGLYRSLQLITILLLPFLLMLALGGFVNSSAVILWSILCPFGSLLFTEIRQAPRWMLAYLALVILGGDPPASRARFQQSPTNTRRAPLLHAEHRGRHWHRFHSALHIRPGTRSRL